MIGKALAGCGCLGGLISIVLLIAGLGMLAMMNDSHLSELGPVGMVVTPIGLIVAVVSGLSFLLGVVLVMRAPAE